MFLAIFYKNCSSFAFLGHAAGTPYGRKRSGGVYPKGTLRRGLAPTNNKKTQN